MSLSAIDKFSVVRQTIRGTCKQTFSRLFDTVKERRRLRGRGSTRFGRNFLNYAYFFAGMFSKTAGAVRILESAQIINLPPVTSQRNIHRQINMIFKRLFGKRLAPSLQQDVELDMNEVASYANDMATRRGYPEDAAAMMARRVVFLERRGLPGLANLHREVLLFRDEPLASRFNVHRPNGSEGGHCPFYAGIELEPSFDMLTALTPEDRLWVKAPSNSLLFVPKLAEWLRPTGRRAVFWWGKDKEVPGMIVVEGFRLEFLCKTGTSDALEKLQQAEHIGFSNCPDDFEPKPNPRTGFLDKITLQPRHIDLMQDFLKG